jgi:hypothetical protein
MILVTRLLPSEPNTGPWLAAYRAVWGIGSRLRERLDVWPGESACRVRRRSAIGLRTMFRRFTYTLFLEWRPAADACAQDEHRPLGLRKAQSHRPPAAALGPAHLAIHALRELPLPHRRFHRFLALSGIPVTFSHGTA